MKKILLLLLIVIVLPSFKIQAPAGFSIIGKWQGISKNTGAKIIFIFDKEGFVSTVEDGKVLEGKGHYIRGDKYQNTYKVDMASTPLRMDIVMIDVANNQKVTRKGVFKVINTNEIVMVLVQGERIMNLKSKSAMTFKRIKM